MMAGLPFLRHEDRLRRPSASRTQRDIHIYLVALADDLPLERPF